MYYGQHHQHHHHSGNGGYFPQNYQYQHYFHHHHHHQQGYFYFPHQHHQQMHVQDHHHHHYVQMQYPYQHHLQQHNYFPHHHHHHHHHQHLHNHHHYFQHQQYPPPVFNVDDHHTVNHQQIMQQDPPLPPPPPPEDDSEQDITPPSPPLPQSNIITTFVPPHHDHHQHQPPLPPSSPQTPPSPAGAMSSLSPQELHELQQAPWRVPPLKEFRNARCDKCLTAQPLLLEHPLERGRYCERCAVAHGMLSHNPETGVFDHHICHICGGVDCASHEQFKQHCTSKKHHIKLRRLRTSAPPALSFDDQPPASDGINPTGSKNGGSTAVVDQVYASLFHNALYTDSKMCTQLQQHELTELPQFHFDDQDFITDFAASHKMNRNKVIKFLCDFEMDQESLINECGLSCIEEYAALQHDDARLQHIVRSTTAGAARSAFDPIRDNKTAQVEHALFLSCGQQQPPLRTIKIASPCMSAADRALLQHDLRSNTIFGFDTETANHQDFPYVKSALGYGIPHLLQIATLDRVWIFELSGTVEQEHNLMNETLKKHRENSIQYKTNASNETSSPAPTNDNAVRSLFHHNAEIQNPLLTVVASPAVKIAEPTAAPSSPNTNNNNHSVAGTKRVQVLDKKVDIPPSPPPPPPPPPTSSFITLKEMKENDKKLNSASSIASTQHNTKNDELQKQQSSSHHHHPKKRSFVKPVVSSWMFGGDDNYLGGGSDYDPHSAASIEAAAAAAADTRSKNSAQHTITLTVRDAVIAIEEERQAKEFKIALEAASKKQREEEEEKARQRQPQQELVGQSCTAGEIQQDETLTFQKSEIDHSGGSSINNNNNAVLSSAEALLDLHIENELGKAEEENDNENKQVGHETEFQKHLILFSPPKHTQIMLFCSTQTLLSQSTYNNNNNNNQPHQQNWTNISNNNNAKTKKSNNNNHHHHHQNQQHFKWSQLINTSTGCTPVKLYGTNLLDPFPELTELLLTDSRKLLVGFAVGKDKEMLANLVFGPTVQYNTHMAQSCFRAGVLDLSSLFCTTNFSTALPPTPSSSTCAVIGATASSYMNPAGSCYLNNNNNNNNQQQQSLAKLDFFHPQMPNAAPMVGLGQACARMFGRSFAKPKALSTSNWARRPLHRLQLVYAARDALFSRVVFDELQRRSRTSTVSNNNSNSNSPPK